MRNRKTAVRRILSLLLLVTLLFLGTGCRAGDTAGGEAKRIVCVSFPEYDWVRNILGENPGGWEVTLLLDKGVDLHSFQPGVRDILTVTSCDILVYTGGPSGEWIEEALAEADRWTGTSVCLLSVLGDAVRTEEKTEGMQSREEGEDEADEHVWLSLKNADRLVAEIARVLETADPSHAAAYRKNASAYREKIGRLEKEYRAMADGAVVSTILVADRFPFRYLVEDYGISYYAAFPGCSAETEASFQTVAFLAGKVKELSLPAVLKIEGSDGRLAQIVAESAGKTGLKVLTLDSMQSVTGERVREGETYLGVMERNLEVLREAMNP